MKIEQQLGNCPTWALMVLGFFMVFSQGTWAEDFIIGKGDHYSSPRKSGLFRGEKVTFKALTLRVP
jgi:hypothetical protein